MSLATRTAPTRLELPTPEPKAPESPGVPTSPERPERLVSLDAYRGFVMLAMASAGLNLARVARDSFPGSEVWNFLAYQTDHVGWVGCGFWDLIQPSFMFMVGVAMPFSFATRAAKGASRGENVLHVAFRSVLLVVLGVFLSSNGAHQTNYTFVNVLTQIGLGYAVLYLLLGRGWKLQMLAVAVILVGYAALFALYPLPPADFDYAKVGVKPAEHAVFDDPYAAHWNKNSNVAADADKWLLNQLPREKPFEFNEGGYQTLNFVPSIATMLFGLMAGEWLRTGRSKSRKALGLFGAGLVCLAAGLAIDHTIWPDWLAGGADRLAAALGLSGSPFFERTWTLCPIVKRIWTPSWAVFSTGWTLLMLAGFFWVIDIVGLRRWSFPLVVVGMNSIAMYCMAQLMKGWVRGTLKTHFGQDIFTGPPGSFLATYGPIIDAAAILFVLWLVCLWMYRQKVFVRI
jgi:heparan-alpha-glucosaminide N-acetyltransferase